MLVNMERPAPFRICVDHPPAEWAEPTYGRSQPRPLLHPHTIYVGLEVHKDSISARILIPGHESPDVEHLAIRTSGAQQQVSAGEIDVGVRRVKRHACQRAQGHSPMSKATAVSCSGPGFTGVGSSRMSPVKAGRADLS